MDITKRAARQVAGARRLLASAAILVNILTAALPSSEPPSVFACSLPTPTPGETHSFFRPWPIHIHAALAPMVFVGTVLSVEATPGKPFEETATIRVDQAIKGDLAAVVAVDDFGDSSACRHVARPGATELFFIKPAAAARLTLHYAYLGEAVRPATEENISLARLGASLTASIFIPMTTASR